MMYQNQETCIAQYLLPNDLEMILYSHTVGESCPWFAESAPTYKQLPYYQFYYQFSPMIKNTNDSWKE